MNKRIKIYALILSIVYAGMFMRYLVDFIDGFLIGWEEVDKEKVKNKVITLYLDIKPKTGFLSFPTNTSEAAQTPLSILRISKVTVEQQISTSAVPINYAIYSAVDKVALFIIMICMLYVPFLFFKIVVAVTKGEIFGVSVVKRITKIGWIIMAYFVYAVFFRVFDFYYAKQFVQIDGYEIIFPSPDFSILILGLITLFLGEVLRASILMKEEQDLTI